MASAKTEQVARNYDLWLEKVNAIIERETGLSLDDLADCSTRDWFEDGVSPIEAANLVLEDSGY